MSRSNPIIQRLLGPDGNRGFDKQLINEAERERQEALVREWMEKLKDASLEDGKNPGGHHVARILRQLIVGIKQDEVELLVLRQLLKHKQWSNRIQQMARKELNWRLS